MTDDDSKEPGALARAKSRATAAWQDLQDRYPWLRHVLATWQLLNRNNGNQYAAAITYFSFVALFPLLLLAVSVTGFVLDAHPEKLSELFSKITESVPGGFGTILKDSIRQAIDARAGVGAVGLVGILLTGLGWIGNLREAVDGVWGRVALKKNFLMARVSNLVVLVGLGVGILVSLALTTVGTSLTAQILDIVGLDGVPGTTILLKIVGVAIAVVGDMFIFWWVLVKLPQADITGRPALRGLLLAAVGFEVLKIVGTYTIAHAGTSKTAGPFVGVIAILAWIYLVARWLMFCCAWLATVAAVNRSANRVPVVEPAAMANSGTATETAQSSITPATVGATLIGGGALVGAVATLAVTRSGTKAQTQDRSHNRR